MSGAGAGPGTGSATSSRAAAPARYALGEIVVTGLHDGVLHESVEVLHGIEPDAATELLRVASRPDGMTLTVNAFLVQAGGMLILIDAGCGDAMGPEAGRVHDSLAQAGVAPDDIGLVLLTHMHPDHIGGLLQPDGAPRFGGARVLAPAADAAVFLDDGIAASAPDAAKPVFAKARAMAAAYGSRFGTFADGHGFPSGIAPVSLPGHSPGHTGFRVSDEGRSLLIWGDIVHVPALQFSHPEIGVVFDTDPALAERTRRDAFAAAARSAEVVAGMHLPVPGFARIGVAATGYQAHPVHTASGVGRVP